MRVGSDWNGLLCAVGAEDVPFTLVCWEALAIAFGGKGFSSTASTIGVPHDSYKGPQLPNENVAIGVDASSVS